jgi:hypothetical protein
MRRRQPGDLDLVDVVVADWEGDVGRDIGLGRGVLGQGLVLAMQGVDGLAAGSAVL